MTDDDLRALVKAAVDRHFRGGPPSLNAAGAAAPVDSLRETRGADEAGVRPAASDTRPVPAAVIWRGHPSHSQYLTVINSGDACVIEPAVPCDHCGYCKSHGH
jgi:hypothetical protein